MIYIATLLNSDYHLPHGEHKGKWLGRYATVEGFDVTLPMPSKVNVQIDLIITVEGNLIDISEAN